MSAAETFQQQGIERHQAGDFIAAEQQYTLAIEADPALDTCRYLLATLWLQQGKFTVAIEAFQKLLLRLPNLPDLHNNLGVASKAVGHFDAARESFQHALKLAPDYEQALFNLAVLCEETGRNSQAKRYYQKSLEQKSDDVQIHYRLGNLLAAEQNWALAAEHLQQVIEVQPDNLDVRVNLAYVYSRDGHWERATEQYTAILQAKPNYSEVLNSYSYVKEQQGSYTEAEKLSRKAIQFSPQFAEAYNNLGIALRSQHRFAEALEAFSQSGRLKAGFALADFNLGTTRLLLEQYPQGWSGYSKYIQLEQFEQPIAQAPVWDGKSIAGKRMLVYCDQGFGDALQFVRFLPRIEEISGAKTIFVTHPALLRLFENGPGTDHILSSDQPWPEHDFQLPLGLAPAILNVTIDELDDSVPRLHSRHDLPPVLQSMLDSAAADHKKVGLVWQGNPQQGRDHERSLPLQLLLPLANVPQIDWYSLQFGDRGRNQLSAVATEWSITDLTAEISDFADTAAVLNQLDLLITVDTASAHLAGAMQIPTWVLLQYTPDWRWHIEREDSPWYPGMRLFRQKTPGNWPEVIDQVYLELQK